MARITKPLTNTEIERAKPKQKDYTLSDGGGLYLLVKSNASKLWRFNYYKPYSNPKKRVLLGLGKYPDMTLQQARKQRDEYLSLLAQNVDPQTYRQQQEAEEFSKQNNSLLAVAEQWRIKKSAEVLPRTLQKNWRRLERYLFPTLGNDPISLTTPKTLSKVLQAINDRGIGNSREKSQKAITTLTQ